MRQRLRLRGGIGHAVGQVAGATAGQHRVSATACVTAFAASALDASSVFGESRTAGGVVVGADSATSDSSLRHGGSIPS